MNLSVRRTPRDLRIIPVFLVLVSLSLATLVFGLSRTANAQLCQYAGHVYYTNRSGQSFVKWETDPPNGQPYRFSSIVTMPGELLLNLGGNGIKPGEQPFFAAYDSAGRNLITRAGHTANSSCVSNQEDQRFPILVPGQTMTIKVTYATGNSNIVVRDQNLMQIVFF
jgi:hypothetical protein